MKGHLTIGRMKGSSVVRTLSATLGTLFFFLYVAAKVHFFTHYDPLGLGAYLRVHSLYWAAMATVAILAWIIAKIFRV